MTLLLTPWTYALLCEKVVPLNLPGLPLCVKIARVYEAKACGRISAGWWVGGSSVLGDTCERHFRTNSAMAAAWFSHRRPDVGRVTVSGLLCRGTISGLLDPCEKAPLVLFRCAAFSRHRHGSHTPWLVTHGPCQPTIASSRLASSRGLSAHG